MTMKESGRQWRLRHGLSPAMRRYIEAERDMNQAEVSGNDAVHDVCSFQASDAWNEMTEEEELSTSDRPVFVTPQDVVDWAIGVLGEPQ